jgi:CubicO group peptidase (beta-lactamase class C family)
MTASRGPRISRRLFLSAAAATVAFPARAAAPPWQRVADTARALEQCHALAIRLAGTDVLAEAFRGPPIGHAVPIKSVSKSIVAALTGAALDRGEIPSLDAPLGDLAPQLIPPGADGRVAGITVAQLVTMQAGLERTSGGNYGAWVSSRDWVANALARPVIAEPGSRMLYSTGSFHILGAVLSERAGESLLDLARSRLGQPLGIDIPPWTRDPQGRYMGGNEMALSVPAMLRFGEMYRLGGRWGDRQVLSRDWVEATHRPRTRSPFSGLDYGLGWFVGSAGGHRYILARGFGGQVICVAPSLELTLALTSDPTRPARSAGHFGAIMDLIENAIIPTARAQI